MGKKLTILLLFLAVALTAPAQVVIYDGFETDTIASIWTGISSGDDGDIHIHGDFKIDSCYGMQMYSNSTGSSSRNQVYYTFGAGSEPDTSNFTCYMRIDDATTLKGWSQAATDLDYAIGFGDNLDDAHAASIDVVDSSGYLCLMLCHGATKIDSLTVIQEDVTYEIGFIMKQATGSDFIRMYVDGTLKAEYTGASWDTPGYLCFGKVVDGTQAMGLKIWYDQVEYNETSTTLSSLGTPDACGGSTNLEIWGVSSWSELWGIDPTEIWGVSN